MRSSEGFDRSRRRRHRRRGRRISSTAAILAVAAVVGIVGIGPESIRVVGAFGAAGKSRRNSIFATTTTTTTTAPTTYPRRQRRTSASGFALRASPTDEDDADAAKKPPSPPPTPLTRERKISDAVLPFLTLAGWPAVAIAGLPALVENARSLPPNSTEQIAAVGLLIVASRVYLYALGCTIVATAALRSSSAGDPPELGKRLTRLTEELLVFDKPLDVAPPAAAAEAIAAAAEDDDNYDYGARSAKTASAAAPERRPPSFVRKMADDSGVEETLDGVDAGIQALVLPVAVAGLLAVSVVALPIFSGELAGAGGGDGVVFPEWISSVVPLLSSTWNALLLTLFARAEFRRLGYELFGWGGPSSSTTTTNTETVGRTRIAVEVVLAASVTLVGAYYLRSWPAQNFVNAAVAVLVARAIRLDSFTAVVGALTLLTLYDGVSVLLLPGAAGAVDSSSAMSTSTTLADAASSAMGSVAFQKLFSTGGFQPGLLVTKIDGTKLTGALGLGDAVFPAILASFLRRFDEDCDNQDEERERDDDDEKKKKSRLFEASLVGYLAGCGACELAPSIGTRGVPALTLIVPAMGLATALAAARAGRLEEVRRYGNGNSDE